MPPKRLNDSPIPFSYSELRIAEKIHPHPSRTPMGRHGAAPSAREAPFRSPVHGGNPDRRGGACGHLRTPAGGCFQREFPTPFGNVKGDRLRYRLAVKGDRLRCRCHHVRPAKTSKGTSKGIGFDVDVTTPGRRRRQRGCQRGQASVSPGRRRGAGVERVRTGEGRTSGPLAREGTPGLRAGMGSAKFRGAGRMAGRAEGLRTGIPARGHAGTGELRVRAAGEPGLAGAGQAGRRRRRR